MFRKALKASALAAAVGVPAAIWQSDTISNYASGLVGGAGEAQVAAYESDVQSTSVEKVSDPTLPLQTLAGQSQVTIINEDALPPLAGPAVEDLSEVLNIDVTRQSIIRRWGRVTTTVADVNYDGLRVSLVSGTSSSDLCGALTFYFDRHGEAQRLAFHGTVGDPERLKKTLTGKLDFRRQQSIGGQLFTSSYLGNMTGVCRLRRRSWRPARRWCNTK